MTAQGLGTQAIILATGESKTYIWRWQERFMAEDVDGLLHDKTHPPGSRLSRLLWLTRSWR